MDRTKPSVFVRVVKPGQPDGERVDVTETVLTFSYEDDEEKADLIKLTVRNHDLSAFDDPTWKKGNVLEVSWGYPGAMSPPRRCEVTSVKGFDVLTIEAHALSMAMNSEKKCRAWESVRRSDVARAIAVEWGYGPEMQVIEDTTTVFETISQARQGDAAFLRKLARLEGYQFFLDFDGLHFHRRNLAQRTHRTYTYFTDPGRGDIEAISIENDVTAKPAATMVQARDPTEKVDLAVLARTPGGANGEDVPMELADSSDEYAQRYGDWFYSSERGMTQMGFPIDLQGQPRPGLAPLPEIITAASAADPSQPATPIPPLPPQPPGGHHVETRRDADGRLRDVWVDADLNEITSSPPREPGIIARAVISTETTPQTGEAAVAEAQAKQDRVQQTAVKMKLTIVGDPTILAKTVVEVLGISRRLSGRYYVSSVKHEVLPAPYKCVLQARSDGTHGYQAPGMPEASRDDVVATTPGNPNAIQEVEQVDPDGGVYRTWQDASGRELPPGDPRIRRQQVGFGEL
jgi:phage protein D